MEYKTRNGPIEIFTVSMVRLTDLCEGLSDATVTLILESVDKDFSYGDCLHSLVSVDAFNPQQSTDEPEIAEFFERLRSLPLFVTVDLES
jgi:hypothetical protein